ncbi:MAG: mechanosensitive ion channel family protein [Betaproteobacteria bacterium]
MTLGGLLQSEAPWLAVLALVIARLLLHLRPQDRGTFLNTLSFFLLCLLGQGFAVLVDMLHGGLAAAIYLVFRIGAAIAFIRLAGFAVFRLAMPLAGKHPPRIIEDLAIIAAYVVYGLFQLRLAGLDLSSLVTTSAILTAVLAFAMQDTLGNVLGGIAIQLDHTVQIGDWVRVDNLVGRVRDIRWRSTLIETRDWETVVVPNSALMKGRVAILGRREGAPPQWRRQLDFMVDPGVPPARVIATLDEQMHEAPIASVARTPPASTVMTGFDRGNVCYRSAPASASPSRRTRRAAGIRALRARRRHHQAGRSCTRARVMGSRRGDLERARETAAAVARAVPIPQQDLVSRIRRFFGVRG